MPLETILRVGHETNTQKDKKWEPIFTQPIYTSLGVKDDLEELVEKYHGLYETYWNHKRKALAVIIACILIYLVPFLVVSIQQPSNDLSTIFFIALMAITGIGLVFVMIAHIKFRTSSKDLCHEFQPKCKYSIMIFTKNLL